MNHRISAGGLVVKDDKILLVRHRKEDAYDFFVAPGGGVEGIESVFDAAKREVLEETSILVEPSKIVYIEELYNPEERIIKVWIKCNYLSGTTFVAESETAREHVVDAGWFEKTELENMRLFPEILKTEFWDDYKNGFSEVIYLPIHDTEFY